MGEKIDERSEPRGSMASFMGQIKPKPLPDWSPLKYEKNDVDLGTKYMRVG